MKSIAARSLFAALFAASLLLPAASSVAQAPPPIRLAVVNPAKVFNEMAETKALQTKLRDDQKKFEAESATRGQKVAEMKKMRDESFKPGTPQYNDASNKLYAESAAYKVWMETERLKAETATKLQMKGLFDKIQTTIAKIAARDGIDLVIADSSDRLPEDLDKVPAQALQSMILQKDVLYVSPKPGLDITSAVLLQLDADYKAVAPAGN